MTIDVIQDKQAFEQVVNEKEAFILLKHSLTCPVSTFAHHQYKQFTDGANVPCYILHVQEARDLSSHIASEYGVQHESPQALYFKNGQVVWHDSHGAITADQLKEVTA
ncbi:bacillithiol system redox-active protein YtxJ [Halobacillus halophilus]|uniref:bacillithiol system redox-active protein YtxJ n=1 Tax=Halobacillus halophilus TaxID=1570 RepID=UPI001368C2B5|nr:bacillithiol system redox-active protein YtxJ [Halobacillus halophilus]MYL29202.1 bacillithiol system redox-active protein YtxJ [Halobacillus halophilus]